MDVTGRIAVYLKRRGVRAPRAVPPARSSAASRSGRGRHRRWRGRRIWPLPAAGWPGGSAASGASHLQHLRWPRAPVRRRAGRRWPASPRRPTMATCTAPSQQLRRVQQRRQREEVALELAGEGGDCCARRDRRMRRRRSGSRAARARRPWCRCRRAPQLSCAVLLPHDQRLGVVGGDEIAAGRRRRNGGRARDHELASARPAPRLAGRLVQQRARRAPCWR